MPVYFKNTSHDIVFGESPIEKMGGDKVTFSMYGDEIPVVLEDGEYIVKVRYNDYNLIYLTSKGNLYGCGDNSYGQLGLSSDITPITSFVKIVENVKDFTAYSNILWYLTNSGELYGCGANTYGRLGSGNIIDVKQWTKRAENVKQFYCGTSTSWYITNSGDLYGCGYNKYGEQGSGDTTTVTMFTKRAENVKKIFTTEEDGLFATWYINNDGDLYGCGYNNKGQQGSGNTTNVTKFTKRAENVKDVKVFQIRTVYINNNNDLYSCGWNGYGPHGTGQWGADNLVKTFTKIASNIKDFDCSENTTWYIDQNDDLYGCGSNVYGQQGDGTTDASITTFTKRASNVKDVTCGKEYTSWYITDKGDLYGCGMGKHGMQGSGNTNNVLTFTKRASNVKEVHSDLWQTFYITNDNEFYICGCNYYDSVQAGGGQGSGNTNNVLVFTKRAADVKEAVAKYQCSWYLTNNNKIFASGNKSNNKGQLGLGYTSTANYVFTEAKLPEE